jgi:hypothetical protein
MRSLPAMRAETTEESSNNRRNLYVNNIDNIKQSVIQSDPFPQFAVIA